MRKTIEYYFSPISGFAYLGHQAFLDMAKDAQLDVTFCPIDIVKVFAASDTTPPAKQSAARKSYRQEDMQRYAALHKVPIKLTPKFWPTASTLACKAIISAKELDVSQADVSSIILKGVWVMDVDIADAGSLINILTDASLPGSEIIDYCDNATVANTLDELTHSAIEKGVFGSPTYILEDERYWGQDRLPLLKHRLT